jgi:class 3 adenylate cyclase
MLKHSKQKAILFADISGSSALYKNRGNAEAKQIVEPLLRAMSQIVVENKGKIIKNIGDEIMTSFHDARNGLFSAIAMQMRFKDLLDENQLRLSIGIGFGEVISEKQDLFGEAVNDAAYLTSLAKGGQILLTADVFSQLDRAARVNIREFDKVTIKGAEQASLVYRVFWQQGMTRDKETHLMSAEGIASELGVSLVKIAYAGRDYLLASEQPDYFIGRDPKKCDLVINKSRISREHCHISFSRGKFVLVDHSTNGTYLSTDNRNELYIRREEFPLIENTSISLGLPFSQSEEDIIELTVIN